MAIELRDYQKEARSAIVKEWDSGNLSTLAVMATGCGKSEVALGTLAQEFQEGRVSRILAIAHRSELIYQPRDRVIEHWTDQLPVPGIVMAKEDECDSRFVVATVQSLSEKRLQRALVYGEFSHVWADECFPAGTLVNGKPIESLRVGDYVESFSEKSLSVGPHRVTGLFRNPTPSHLVRIVLSNGQQIITTFNHPFYGRNGWTEAARIQIGDFVLVKQEIKYVAPNKEMPGLRKANLNNSDTMSQVRWDSQNKGTIYPLRGMRCGCCREWMESQEYKKIYGECLLLGRVQKEICFCKKLKGYGEYEQVTCFRQNEKAQPHAILGKSPEDVNHFARYATQAADSGWERQANRKTPEIACGSVGLADRSSCDNRNSRNRKSAQTSRALQIGYSEYGIKNSYRSRRIVAQYLAGQIEGRQEGGFLAWERVDSVEILESGGDRTFGGLCPDGYVYNIEVEIDHTYIANGFVVHNCHHSVSPSWLSLIKTLRNINPRLRLLGTTATPKRTDRRGLKGIFDSVAYRLGIKDAIGMGALCPFVAMAVELPVDIGSVKKTKDGWDDTEVGKILSLANAEEVIVETWKKHASDRQTIAFTASVQQAVSLMRAFERAGVKAATVNDKTPKEERKAILEAYSGGGIQFVSNYGILTEGYDAPATSCVIMARPTKSDLVYIQAVGRGLRLAPGKQSCLILDFAPRNARNMRLAGDLLGKPPEQRKKEQNAERSGLILSCFGINSQGEGVDGDPDEVQMRVLDYLGSHHLAWTYDGGLATVSIAPKTSLVVVLPQQERIARAEALRSSGRWNEAWESEYRKITGYQVFAISERRATLLGIGVTWDAASSIASAYADTHAEDWCSKKQSRWRNAPASEKQQQYCRVLGIWRDGMTRGVAGQAITHAKALAALRNAQVLR